MRLLVSAVKPKMILVVSYSVVEREARIDKFYPTGGILVCFWRASPCCSVGLARSCVCFLLCSEYELFEASEVCERPDRCPRSDCHRDRFGLGSKICFTDVAPLLG